MIQRACVGCARPFPVAALVRGRCSPCASSHQLERRGGIASGWEWTEVRRKIIARDGGCVVCEETDSTLLRVHHRTPLAEGGTNEWTNLETRCIDCHADAHRREAA